MSAPVTPSAVRTPAGASASRPTAGSGDASPFASMLDDALSAVDTETEARILGHLRQARLGRTVVIAGHRLSAVADADRTVVLQAGRIVDASSGVHQAGGTNAAFTGAIRLSRDDLAATARAARGSGDRHPDCLLAGRERRLDDRRDER